MNNSLSFAEACWHALTIPLPPSTGFRLLLATLVELVEGHAKTIAEWGSTHAAAVEQVWCWCLMPPLPPLPRTRTHARTHARTHEEDVRRDSRRAKGLATSDGSKTSPPHRTNVCGGGRWRGQMSTATVGRVVRALVLRGLSACCSDRGISVLAVAV